MALLFRGAEGLIAGLQFVGLAAQVLNGGKSFIDLALGSGEFRGTGGEFAFEGGEVLAGGGLENV